MFEGNMKKIIKPRSSKKGPEIEVSTVNGSVDKKTKKKSFSIIAMGGSAGSFEAFEKFFTHMSANSGMAFVVIIHLDQKHVSNLSQLIQQYTVMPVKEAGDGMEIRADHVYVIPANKDMGIHNGKLLLLPQTTHKGLRLPVDYFFQSLAEDQWNRAVGIIFSGMGSDGETGLRMIKEKLGMAMVQDPETAQYDSMPKSAIKTNLVDYILAPEEMPVKLIQYLRHPLLVNEANDEVIAEVKSNTAFQKILMLLRTHTGHDFTLYKKNTIIRRIDRRVAFHQLPDYTHYVNYLRENPEEINVLFNELLIGVTKFFRDAGAFAALKEKLFSHLDKKAEGESIRVWVPGCSTGEEAYSIAIILSEYLEKHQDRKMPRVQIFATDLDGNSIDHARQGFYLENIVADVSNDRIERFFIKKSNGYQVKKELREMIVFAQHNIIKDAPFTRLDLLSCRNLMIYLTTELQKKIIPVFYYSLNPGGFLLLGPAETVGGFTDMFSPIDAKWKLSSKKEGASLISRMVDFPFRIAESGSGQIKSEVSPKPLKKNTLQDHFYKILLENYTPASLLLNEKGDILYINGKTGRYLELSTGEAQMNIHRMAREELRFPLSNAIHQARTHKATVSLSNIKLKINKTESLVNIKAVYLEDFALTGVVMVVFEEAGIPETVSSKKRRQSKSEIVEVDKLEKELTYTREQLHTTIEQMETSVEELKSTNEELQSTNEELQSTNEESLTTKEEMQSLNEELMTINMQYQSKAEELTQLNNDMKNLLDSTQTGTIFLDNDLHILRYTPQVKKLFNVIGTDVGRSISHVVSNFEYNGLEDDIRATIENLKVHEVNVCTKTGDWYQLRMSPYRTLDNFINGAVLTFNRITQLKELETKFNFLQSSFGLLVETQKHPAVLYDEKLNLITANKAFQKLFGIKEKDIKMHNSLTIICDKWKAPSLPAFLKKSVKSKVTLDLVSGSPAAKVSYTLTATPVKDNKLSAAIVLLVIEGHESKKKSK